MTERWSDDRLDRFANTVEQAIAASDERLTQVEQTQTMASSERQELREVFLATMQVVSESARCQDEILTEIHTMQSQVAEMQSEVRGLQVENRRIINRVFGGES